ncbi:glycine reductase, partial [Lachnospiraceae bacterium PAL227]|nr:glycine reductase [Ohessyouella blattaphilus]MCR8564995.1 glycine reductase [Ohessyouella blattaphilus]
MAKNLNELVASTFLEIAEGIESGSFAAKPKIALTGMGSEHGEANAIAGAQAAAKMGIDVYYIGTLEAEGVTTIHVADEEEGHKKMEELLDKKEVDGA